MSELDNDMSEIEPVTNMQKHWRVLTFHEDRLNKLDMVLKEGIEGGVSNNVGDSMLGDKINRLSSEQNQFISSHTEKVDNIERSIIDRLETINDKCDKLFKSLDSRLGTLESRVEH